MLHISEICQYWHRRYLTNYLSKLITVTLIHGHMLTGQLLTGQMLTPLSKNRTNAYKIWFWHGKFVNMDTDVIWLITFTARCTIVQSTVLPSLCCTADVMWNAHRDDFTRTDCDNYVEVVVDAGAIMSHFCSPLISPTMSLSWSRATVLRRLWSSHRRCRRKYESCLRIRPRLYKDVMR